MASTQRQETHKRREILQTYAKHAFDGRRMRRFYQGSACRHKSKRQSRNSAFEKDAARIGNSLFQSRQRKRIQKQAEIREDKRTERFAPRKGRLFQYRGGQCVQYQIQP